MSNYLSQHVDSKPLRSAGLRNSFFRSRVIVLKDFFADMFYAFRIKISRVRSIFLKQVILIT